MMNSSYDRQELIGILSSLSDDRLIQAMSAAGVQVSPGDLSNDLALPDPVDELTPWNRTAVKVPFTSRPPIVNQSRLLEMPQPPRQPSFLSDPRMDSIAPYAGAIA